MRNLRIWEYIFFSDYIINIYIFFSSPTLWQHIFQIVLTFIYEYTNIFKKVLAHKSIFTIILCPSVSIYLSVCLCVCLSIYLSYGMFFSTTNFMAIWNATCFHFRLYDFRIKVNNHSDARSLNCISPRV